MPPFTASIGNVTLVPLPDGRRFHLLYPVEYRYGELSWVVPAAATTDFASIPGIGRLFLPKWGMYGWSAIWHDWAYSKAGPDMTRKEIDDMFLAFMKVNNTPIHEQFLIYYSVRMFGWMFFKKQ